MVCLQPINDVLSTLYHVLVPTSGSVFLLSFEMLLFKAGNQITGHTLSSQSVILSSNTNSPSFLARL